jgi:hypothetical protein
MCSNFAVKRADRKFQLLFGFELPADFAEEIYPFRPTKAGGRSASDCGT